MKEVKLNYKRSLVLFVIVELYLLVYHTSKAIFKSNLQKFSEKGKEGCSDFFRRINLWHTLGGLNRSEIKEICMTEGITDKDRVKELCRYNRLVT